MGIHKLSFSLFPKYQFLLGLNIIMHETFDVKTEEAYDGMDVEIGLGILLFTISILTKKKGAS